jgi:hypothetical protein
LKEGKQERGTVLYSCLQVFSFIIRRHLAQSYMTESKPVHVPLRSQGEPALFISYFL